MHAGVGIPPRIDRSKGLPCARAHRFPGEPDARTDRAIGRTHTGDTNAPAHERQLFRLLRFAHHVQLSFCGIRLDAWALNGGRCQRVGRVIATST